MPNTELRGLFKLDANNNIYADGDVCEAGGTVTRRYGIVDLGTLTWNYNSTYSFFYADISELKTVIGNDTIGNLICHKYVTVSLNTLMDASTGVICVRPTQNAIRIKDSNYTDKNTFTTAVSGLYLIYEKATPTTESSTPFQSPQICDNWGTEEYVDGRTVEIPVGHETEYYREA